MLSSEDGRVQVSSVRSCNCADRGEAIILWLYLVGRSSALLLSRVKDEVVIYVVYGMWK